MHVFIERLPKHFDTYEVAIATHVGRYTQYAAGIGEDGELLWETTGEGAVIPTLFRARKEVIDALAAAAAEVTQASDQTLSALNDAKVVRDRLLTLIEKGWEK